MRYALNTVNPLDDIRVASPCSVGWESMAGDDQARFCSDCHKHVYNISAMTTEEATALVREKEGELCVRFYRRCDGTVLTADCPIGLRQLVRHPSRWASALLAALFASVLSGLGCGRCTQGKPVQRGGTSTNQKSAPEKEAADGQPQDQKTDQP